ncbi:hypothetical protein FXO38_20844 [Capsicum annuum]|nr:hypothetical protein FXO37_32051 [Capsicum annuum]KAF3642954.1 hypothetical protein FXO38_20844 [Capsicum annuum]
MASSSNFALLLLFFLSFSFLSASTAARPCQTLFFISIFQNPNPTRFRTLFISTSNDPTQFRLGRPLHSPSIIFQRSYPIVIRRPDLIEEEEEDRIMPMELYSSVMNSIYDRPKDIMRVVGALLFGIGCGALTAVIMYLIWSFFWGNRFDASDFDDDEFDVFTTKKLGYVAISKKIVDDDLKKSVTTVVSC